MENKISFMEPLIERAEEYAKTSIELFKLKALNKTAGVASELVSKILFVLVISFFFIMASIGMALWLGELLGKSYYGFFCVAGFYVILGGVVYFFMRKGVKNYISNSFVSYILN